MHSFVTRSLLVERANIETDLRDNFGQIALEYAAKHDHNEIVMLIEIKLIIRSIE
jgi:hypothetical protein